MTCNDTNDNEGNGLHDVMGSMDDELRSTSIPRSFKDSSKEQVGYKNDKILHDF